VVKYGSTISVLEGQNMLFISQNSGIRVPRVYDIYTVAETQKTYIGMEHIKGEALRSA